MSVQGHLSRRLRLNFRSERTPEPPFCQSGASALVEYGAATRVWETKRGSPGSRFAGRAGTPSLYFQQ